MDNGTGTQLLTAQSLVSFIEITVGHGVTDTICLDGLTQTPNSKLNQTKFLIAGKRIPTLSL